MKAFQVRPTDQIAHDGIVESLFIRVYCSENLEYELGPVILLSMDGRMASVSPDEEIPVTGLCPFLHECSVN